MARNTCTPCTTRLRFPCTIPASALRHILGLSLYGVIAEKITAKHMPQIEQELRQCHDVATFAYVHRTSILLLDVDVLTCLFAICCVKTLAAAYLVPALCGSDISSQAVCRSLVDTSLLDPSRSASFTYANLWSHPTFDSVPVSFTLLFTAYVCAHLAVFT